MLRYLPTITDPLATRLFAILSACLCACIIVCAWLSWSIPYGAPLDQTPWRLFVTFLIVAGFMFWGLVWIIRKLKPKRHVLLTLFLVGLVMRGVMFLSAPVMEDDWYRYLWDGATVSAGIDPYKYPPAKAAPTDLFGNPVQTPPEQDLEHLQELAQEHHQTFTRINYPYVATIYPPVAQGAFALSHTLSPFSLTGWRSVLLIFDIGAFACLLLVLRGFKKPIIWSGIYWLNPIVIQQVFGSAHMDGMLSVFILLSLLCAIQKRPAIAGVALAGAVGVKIWPILLFPALAATFKSRFRDFAVISLAFGGLCALLLAPQAMRALSPQDGLTAYSSQWQTHSFLFSAIAELVSQLTSDPGQVSRFLVASIISLIGMLCAWKVWQKGMNTLPLAWMVIVGTLLFFSPTGYPWYLVWIAPLLALAYNRGLLLLVATAPLYFLRFYLGDENPVHQWIIVPIAFAPAFALFALDAGKDWRRV